MKKIRVVEYTERWGTGGVEAYMTNLICGLDSEKFDITILAAQREADLYDAQILRRDDQKSSAVHILMQKPTLNPIERVTRTMPLFKKYIEENPCDILHLHISHGMALRYAKIAKRFGVKRVIAQSHNSRFGDKHFLIKWMAHQYGKHVYRGYVDNRLACSDLAANWLFVRKDLGSVAICNYLVDIDRFRFSRLNRDDLRAKYSLTNKTVYLTIGRMHYQKNPFFLLQIFSHLSTKNPDCRLVWIGTGECSSQIHRLANEWNISHKILFIDNTLEIEKYMSMADAFLLPSVYEGNPIVVTEAQASGLPCFLSDAITKQAKILDTTRYISLQESADVWAKRIIEMGITTLAEREVCATKVKNNGYDVLEQLSDMERLYCKK